MRQFKKIIQDVQNVSKITNVSKKKILIFSVAIMAQLTALTDIAIIAIFASIIADQFTGIDFINRIIIFILDFKILILFLVLFRFIFLYLQQTLVKNLEFNVNKNLKIHLLQEIFDKRNYSVADAFFYINTLSGHISYFYSSFTVLITNLLQVVIYITYLLVVDVSSIGSFGIGILILLYPIKKLISAARDYMDKSYYRNQDSNREIQRVVENMFLIKILKQEKYEIERFSKSVEDMFSNLLNNFKIGLVNGFLPTFLTFTTLAILLGFSSLATKITLDFIGVTLRLFQSLGQITNSINQIINSHVHIEKFDKINQNKFLSNKNTYIVDDTKESAKIVFEDTSFSYFNSDEEIFKNLSFSINKNSHVLVTGPNGSGKSTLLGLIAGVLYSTSGNIRTFSDKFGYIGATPLIFEATIYENITYGNNTKPDNEEILNFMKKFDLFKEDSNYDLNKIISNKTLSSGQMQKIAFIRALLSDIEILLLDEATANLDQNSKKFIFKILKKRGITIINSTHDPNSFGKVDMNLKIKIEDENRIVEII